MDEKEKEYLLVKLNEAIENKTRYRVDSKFWKEIDELRSKNKDKQRL